jgi:hypothetical protein
MVTHYRSHSSYISDNRLTDKNKGLNLILEMPENKEACLSETGLNTLLFLYFYAAAD